MKFLFQLNYKTLYRCWAALFAVTAVLGLLFPGVSDPVGLFFLGLISAVFFLPPALILRKARREDNLHHVRLVRYLGIASLTATLVLICAGIRAVTLSQAAGDLVHILMTVICAPLVCSNYYVLPMFLWSVLVVCSFRKKK